MNDNKFKSLNELKDSIEMGLDIECYIYGKRYYIGAPRGKLLISLCPSCDGESYIETIYPDIESLLKNHKINGQPLKEIWQDIEIRSM